MHQREKKHPKRWRSLLTLLFVLALHVSNPSYQQHREIIAAEVKMEFPLFGLLGGGKFVAGQTVYHNYILFSTTTIRGELISWGILDHVWVELPGWIAEWDPFRVKA